MSITQENYDNHGSVKTLREVYQGTHFEFNRVSKDKVHVLMFISFLNLTSIKTVRTKIKVRVFYK